MTRSQSALRIASEMATEQLEWSEGFATGIAEVDRQHRTLLALLDEVRALAAAQRHHDQHDRLGAVLDQLNEYASTHFVTEEDLLRQHLAKDPATAVHIQAHRSYWTAITGYQRKLRYGDPDICEDLYCFLRQWWVGHILTTDQAMGAALTQLGVH